MPSEGPREPDAHRKVNRGKTRDERVLWVQTAVWAALALGVGLTASATHGWWRLAFIVLNVLFAGLAVWVGMFAVLFSVISKVARTDGPVASIWSLVPWWVWAVASLVTGLFAGTGVYLEVRPI